MAGQRQRPALWRATLFSARSYRNIAIFVWAGQYWPDLGCPVDPGRRCSFAANSRFSAAHDHSGRDIGIEPTAACRQSSGRSNTPRRLQRIISDAGHEIVSAPNMADVVLTDGDESPDRSPPRVTFGDGSDQNAQPPDCGHGSQREAVPPVPYWTFFPLRSAARSLRKTARRSWTVKATG
jgi:hypothetical protein